MSSVLHCHAVADVGTRSGIVVVVCDAIHVTIVIVVVVVVVVVTVHVTLRGSDGSSGRMQCIELIAEILSEQLVLVKLIRLLETEADGLLLLLLLLRDTRRD